MGIGGVFEIYLKPLFSLRFALLACVAAEPWPASSSALTASRPALTPSFEPSGNSWHRRLEQGQPVVHRYPRTGGNLEGIAIADPQTNFVYVAVEYPAAILEYDLSCGRVTRCFKLSDFIKTASK